VGVGGHSLHGGFGFSSHSHGLAVDWIDSANVVLANGTAVTASATENKDIFWALKGAGSNFGIVTSFQFKTFAAPTNVTVYQIRLPWSNSTAIVKGWTDIQEWLGSGGMPEEMNMRVLGDRSGAQLQGQYFGNATSLRAAIKPLLDTMNVTLSSVKETDWMGAFKNYAYSAEIDITRPYEQVCYAPYTN
jgi:FAD/FMN-containing dehydrogenase